MNKKLTGFAPVVNSNTKVLILGSFPGVQALQKRQYYGNPHNHFWRIASDLIGHDLISESYDARLKLLLRNSIGIWDTIGSCRRKGSLDTAIKDIAANDIASLLARYPNIRAVFLNGQKAMSLFDAPSDIGVDVYCMPSTSPANTISYRSKLSSWRKVLNYI